MAVTSGDNSEKTAKRGPGRPYQSGQSGNPSGRPKLGPTIEAMRSLARTYSAEAFKFLASVMRDKKEPTSTRIEAADRLLLHGLGTPKALVDVMADGPEVGKITVEYVNDWRTQDRDSAPALAPPGRPEPSDRH